MEPNRCARVLQIRVDRSPPDAQQIGHPRKRRHVEQRGGHELLQRALGTRKAADRRVQYAEGRFIIGGGSFIVGGGRFIVNRSFICKCVIIGGVSFTIYGSFTIHGSFIIDGSFTIHGSFILGVGVVLVNQGNPCGCQNFPQFQRRRRVVGRFVEYGRERKE